MAPREWHSATTTSSNSKEILRYGSIGGRPHHKPFIKDLTDNPEFLMLVRH